MTTAQSPASQNGSLLMHSDGTMHIGIAAGHFWSSDLREACERDLSRQGLVNLIGETSRHCPEPALLPFARYFSNYDGDARRFAHYKLSGPLNVHLVFISHSLLVLFPGSDRKDVQWIADAFAKVQNSTSESHATLHRLLETIQTHRTSYNLPARVRKSYKLHISGVNDEISTTVASLALRSPAASAGALKAACSFLLLWTRLHYVNAELTARLEKMRPHRSTRWPVVESFVKRGWLRSGHEAFGIMAETIDSYRSLLYPHDDAYFRHLVERFVETFAFQEQIDLVREKFEMFSKWAERLSANKSEDDSRRLQFVLVALTATAAYPIFRREPLADLSPTLIGLAVVLYGLLFFLWETGDWVAARMTRAAMDHPWLPPIKNRKPR